MRTIFSLAVGGGEVISKRLDVYLKQLGEAKNMQRLK